MDQGSLRYVISWYKMIRAGNWYVRKDLVTVTLMSRIGTRPLSSYSCLLSPLYYHDEIITSIFCTLDNSPKNWEVFRVTPFNLSRQTLPSLISENGILKVITNEKKRDSGEVPPFWDHSWVNFHLPTTTRTPIKNCTHPLSSETGQKLTTRSVAAQSRFSLNSVF